MFTVKFLDDESFEQLPYKGVGNAIGVADRNTNIAYVRDTGNPMDIFTAYHELEHLKGDDLDEHESPDENGIFYKKMRQAFNTILPIAASFIPGVGPILGPATSMALSKFNSPKPNQPQEQQGGPMDQFNPGGFVSQAAQPVTSFVGGMSGGGEGMSSGIGGTISKVREMLKQRQSGFYSGRDAGAF